MSEFESEVVLGVRVDQSQLRAARDEVESSMGDVTVGVDGGTATGGTRMAGRERAMGRRLQSQANAHLDELDDKARHRNELLEDLIDTTEQGDITRARMGGGGGVLGAALGGLIGLGALGGSLLGNLELEPPDIPPVPIPDELNPVRVPVPDALNPVDVPVPTALDPVDIPTPEWVPVETPAPEWLPVTLELPSELPLSEPSPTPSTQPSPTPLPSEEPNRTPRPGGPPSVTAGDVLAVGGGAAVAGGAAYAAKEVSGAFPSGGASAAAPFAAPSIIAARAGRNAQNTPDDQQNILQRYLDRLLPDVNPRTQRAMTASSPTATSTASMNRARERSSSTTINHEPTYEVSGLEDVRRQQERDRQELEQRIDELQQGLTGPSTSYGF